MGRQWLHAKRLVAGLKKGRATSKLVREISVAAKMGGADPAMNARLATAVEKAKKESVAKDVIERAIKKGAGTGDEKLIMEHVVFEGRAPHNVPVIVEGRSLLITDPVQRGDHLGEEATRLVEGVGDGGGVGVLEAFELGDLLQARELVEGDSHVLDRNHEVGHARMVGQEASRAAS